MPRIVVLGGGYAGLATLIALSKQDKSLELHLVDAHLEHCKITNLHKTFRHPVENFTVSYAQLAERFNFTFHHQPLAFSLQEISHWQKQKKLPLPQAGLSFDWLVVSTGASPVSLPGGQSVPGQTALRRGEFDILVGINLLREGLDLPEVVLVAILDADKEGFLRSETSLIQTAGRAARNLNGRAIFYADRITDSMRRAMDETERRREKQHAYNVEHGIEPKTILKDIRSPLVQMSNLDYFPVARHRASEIVESSLPIAEQIKRLEKEMREAAKKLEFEEAAEIRDRLKELREIQIFAE